VHGVIRGVGAVIVFLPNILILFLAIAVLEDSGYMARAAFIMDRWMHKIGLHGKSFIPMVIGFGCTIPAIMATRVLGSRRDRLTTMLILPLMSCSARLPIYMMFTAAFFIEKWRGPVLWTMYVVGAAVAVLAAKLLKSTLFRGEAEPFVMELPPYRTPTVKGTLIHTWRRGWMYVRKAGTIILGVSILLWALTSYPKPHPREIEDLAAEGQQAAALEYSVAGRVGKAFEPVTRPLGFDWRVNTAMIGAFAAKEVFVAQMSIVYSLGDTDEAEAQPLQDALRRNYTPLQAVAVMIFSLLGFPCMATVAVMCSESGSWKWALLQWTGLTGLAYLAALLVYQVGSALGLGVG
jgi:ferrous iron transport protein B